jgi:hypothetical protein
MNTTTKRFARTLDEAFPGSRPASIEGPYRRAPGVLADAAGVIVTLACAALFIHTLLEWAAA